MQLDAIARNELVAMEILGWRWDDDWGCLVPPGQTAKPSEMWSDWKDGLDEDGFPYEYCEPIQGCTVQGLVYNGGFTKVVLPDFQGDDAAACQVIDRMVEQYNCIFTVRTVGEAYRKAWAADAPKCSATIEGGDLAYDTPRCILVREARTRSRAICEAALAIMRNQEEKS